MEDMDVYFESVESLETQLDAKIDSMTLLEKKLFKELEEAKERRRMVMVSIMKSRMIKEAIKTWETSDTTVVIATLAGKYHPTIVIPSVMGLIERFIFPADVTEKEITDTIQLRCQHLEMMGIEFGVPNHGELRNIIHNTPEEVVKFINAYDVKSIWASKGGFYTAYKELDAACDQAGMDPDHTEEFDMRWSVESISVFRKPKNSDE